MSIAIARSPWEHQIYAFEQAKLVMGNRPGPNLITSPTGGGKTFIMAIMIHDAVSAGKRVSLYTNRRMLVKQLSGSLTGENISHGIRSSEYAPALLRDIQISSIQTERSRVYNSAKWDLHDAHLVFIDEAHLQKEETAQRVINDHIEAGADIFGFSATPLGLSHIYKNLIVAGTNSELRACGALVRCDTYGPDEPDTKHIKKIAIGEDISEKTNRKIMMVQGIFGRVHEHWQRLNPDARPAILFAPGVKESIWFAEQFRAKGIRAAHIDGENVWLDGEEFPTSDAAREDIIGMSESGEIKIICNRFVLREGIDLPWLYHGIFATYFGSLQSYLQSGGRLLRAHPSLDHVILQDHGGNWHRHGSLNSDREWDLELTDHKVTAMRQQKLREKKDGDKEPLVCPNCFAVRSSGAECWKCGHRASTKTRIVVQHNGELKPMNGDIYKPRRILEKSDTQQKWDRERMRGLNSKNGMTFNQVEALFFRDHYYYPPRTLKGMPTRDMDWFELVKNVPRERLR
jgi:superfamily II DNA or RNA helicase